AIVTLWHLDSGRAIRTFEAGPDLVRIIGFSGDGLKLAAGGGTSLDAPGWVTVWDAKTGAVLGALDRVGVVSFRAFHQDGTRLALADISRQEIHLWDVVEGTLITNPGPDAVSCVGFTPDGNRIAAIGYDGNVHLSDTLTGEEVLVLRGFRG